MRAATPGTRISRPANATVETDTTIFSHPTNGEYALPIHCQKLLTFSFILIMVLIIDGAYMERQTRTTKQRTVILSKLREVDTHPTADELYAMTRELLPRLSLGTVYRNLELLARQGDIRCLENGGFQKRFDGDLRPHHHVRCSRCGKIGDVHASVSPLSVRDAHADGFTLTGVEVLFEGICHTCNKA